MIRGVNDSPRRDEAFCTALTIMDSVERIIQFVKVENTEIRILSSVYLIGTKPGTLEKRSGEN